MKRFLIVLLLIAIMLVVGCASNESISTTKSKTLSPMLIKEWKGFATKTTESFSVSSEQWAISWTFQPSTPTYGIYANYFSIGIYDTRGSLPVSLVANFANVNSGQSDISYIHQAGNFYLDISSMSGAWTIKVYDYR